MTTNDQLILTGERACVPELCWQVYKLKLYVISTHTPYLQTLGFHGQIKVTSAIKQWQSWATKSHVARPVLPSAHRKSDTARFETRSTTCTLNSGMKPAHHGGMGSELTERTERDNGSLQGSLTRDGGETFPAFSAYAQPAILRIWQEAHAESSWLATALCSWKCN